MTNSAETKFKASNPFSNNKITTPPEIIAEINRKFKKILSKKVRLRKSGIKKAES